MIVPSASLRLRWPKQVHVACLSRDPGRVRLFERVLKGFGLVFSYVNTCRVDDVRAAFEPNTRLVFIETPTNPVMELTDIAAVAAIAAHGLIVLDPGTVFQRQRAVRPNAAARGALARRAIDALAAVAKDDANCDR